MPTLKDSRPNETLLTHHYDQNLNQNVQKKSEAIKLKIQNASDVSSDDKVKLTMVVDQLSEFELGRFLIQNDVGLNGFWTHYLICEAPKIKASNTLEEFLIHKAPVIQATQERFGIFQAQLTRWIKSGDTVCSLPCGVMGDLLTLKLDPEIQETIQFIGIDFDSTVFAHAQKLAEEKQTKTPITFLQEDAWNLSQTDAFDVLTSNGLNIYVEDEDKVVDLYHSFHRALKPNGVLITSFLTYPSIYPDKTEWLLDKIDKEALKLQVTLFSQILQAKWSHFRTSEQTKHQLEKAGFTNIEFFWDTAKMFPTVVAIKS